MFDNKYDNRIILTCIGGPLKKFEILFLKNKSKYNNYVVGIDVNSNNTGKRYVDKFYKTPNGLSVNYIKKIIQIVKKDRINLILPCSDEEALVLTRFRKDLLKLNCDVASTNYKNIKIFSNKLKTYAYLKKSNIAVPKYKKILNYNSLIKEAILYKKNDLEFVVKPSVSRGGRNVFVVSHKNIKTKINNNREMYLSYKNFIKISKNKFEKLFPLILMEKLYDPIYDLDMFTHKGNLINSVLRRRVVPDNPNAGHLVETSKIKFTNIGKKIAKLFNLNWLYDCDIMIDKNNKPKILEINPRPSGSTSIALSAGIHLLDNVLEKYKKEKLSIYKIKSNKIIMPDKIIF